MFPALRRAEPYWTELSSSIQDDFGPRVQRSPYSQRPMEPGDLVMITLPIHNEYSYLARHNGLTGEIVDYGVAEGSYKVDGVEYSVSRQHLFQWDYEWSGT